MRITMLIVLLLLCAAPIASGAEPATERTETNTRVYDVRDFIMRIPDFPFTETMGMPEEPDFAFHKPAFEQAPATTKPRPRTREQMVEELIELIRDTIDPNSWRDAGGDNGMIREIGGQLIITQTLENQKQVESILGQLRETSQSVVRVQADWVMLRPDQLAAVMKPAEEKKGAKMETRIVDLEALMGSQSGHFHGEISCLNGQQVSISSGRSRTVIYDQEAVVAQNAVALNPRVKQVREGAMLQVTPTVFNDSSITAVIEVHSKVAHWGAPSPVTQGYSATTTRPGDRAITGVPDSAVIDRLNLATQELRATVRVPLNQPILVGGMTLEPSPDQPQGVQLYLILRVSTSG